MGSHMLSGASSPACTVASRGVPKNVAAQLIESRFGRNRVESPRHYPDNDIVSSRMIAFYLESQPGMSVRVIDELTGDGSEDERVHR